ncbi:MULTISPECIES: lipase family protein [unclassified Rhodococcus (in: high G+C Gram-positive bacteria)]|uniref:lipase family protein n=1 Tax=unclassified Rhodococcus (in: high G+C Gram-positive bacteria) TaxID=192944 RepID=UPI001C9B9AA3|nr:MULTISPECIES: lipase family protein [unclassified Rhodococcus (in: high G+C Gram-positive bacteria)]MBY6709481.1 prolyl oligopeptidase family serine peptidase [Rhodococcus sp. BP-241]MDQ1203270.1 pimeloyl-ACP methyl ester carboxylesterase [Rhodococcus sp. SORGH_AS_0303]
MTPRSHRTLMVLALAMLTATTAACSSEAPAAPAAPVQQPLPTLDGDTAAQRGTVISSEPVEDIDPSITAVGATATRIVYWSTSGLDGRPTAVSGIVFTPDAPAPNGSRPVVSFGHGTTGVTADCAPSAYPDLLGYASTIVPLMKLGYVAVMTDYQGLGYQGPGSSPVHPYLEPNTSAYNMIDGVRAARAETPVASDKWAAMGVSQGGQAAWSAAELADFYAPELSFVGAVALAPALDLTEQGTLASSRFMTRDQQVGFPFLVSGLTAAVPDAVPADYLHGVLAQDSSSWTACMADTAALARRADKIQYINPSDTVPSTAEAADRLENWLGEIELPRRSAAGPILVVNGDQDETVKPQWVAGAIDKACAMGYSVDHIVRQGQGHDNLDPGAETAIWFEARFRGEPPAADVCA